MIASVMSATSSLLKTCTNSKLGRYVVAAKPIKAGEIILQESPLVRGPFIHTIPVCLSCTRALSSTSQPCSKCGWPVCNADCENSSLHQPECILTRSRGGITIKNFGIANPNYQFIIILRALTLKEESPDKWNQFLELQAGGKNYNWAPANFVKTFFKLDNWSETLIEKVYAILGTNGHELPNGQFPELVVYGLGSFFEHSCRANCSKTFTDDGDLVIIAATDIKDGDNLSICYTDPFWGAANRRNHLYESKNFVCTCLRCTDPTEMGSNLNSIRCLNK